MPWASWFNDRGSRWWMGLWVMDHDIPLTSTSPSLPSPLGGMTQNIVHPMPCHRPVLTGCSPLVWMELWMEGVSKMAKAIKIALNVAQSFKNCGANGGTRTHDLRFTKPLLYQLSYASAP